MCKYRVYSLAVFSGIILPWIIVALVHISGCSYARAEVPVVMPDKTVVSVKIEYIRWFNQKVGWFILQAPGDWTIGFGGQSADNGASIGYGPVKLKVGGNNE